MSKMKNALILQFYYFNLFYMPISLIVEFLDTQARNEMLTISRGFIYNETNLLILKTKISQGLVINWGLKRNFT